MTMIQEFLPQAERIAARLKASGATLAVSESSTGGLVSAAMLAVPGASAYFMGGAVVYTRQSRRSLLRIPEQSLSGIRPSSQPYALLLARAARDTLGTDWAVGETGAAGPTGNRYTDLAGHSCVAVVGPAGEHAITVETGKADRIDNMRTFTAAALDLLERALG
jgi:nicotinamide-nucleotide amidase